MFNFSRVCIFAIIIFISGVYGVEYLTEKPSYAISCKIYEPEFTQCSTKSIQRLIDEIKKGIPEITKSFGPVDPIKLDKIVFNQDNNAAASITANLTNLLVTGFSKCVIKESRVSKKDFSWQTKIYMPKMRLEGQYKMKGKVLLLPLSGAGDMFIEIENLDLLMHTKTRLYEKGGFTFYNVTQVRIDIDMTGVKTYFGNLFNGNSKEVERSTNEFFNENWRDFFEALRPLITETVEGVLLDLLQTTFHLLPANFIVEDIPTSVQLYGKNNVAQ